MNRLTFIRSVPVGKKQSRKGLFICSCGKEIEARMFDVSLDHTRSCGCFKKELLSARGKKNFDGTQTRKPGQ